MKDKEGPSVIKVEKHLKKYIIQLQGLIKLKTGRSLTQGETASIACYLCMNKLNEFITEDLPPENLTQLLRDIDKGRF